MTDHGMPAPIAVALDAPDLETALGWASAVGPHVSTVKVGLELYLREGGDAVRKAREASGGRDTFLDLKLHDIPNTVAGAARSVAELAPTYLTVHAAGGVDMVRAAVETLPETIVVGVTVLTSLSDDDLDAIGLRGPSRDAVRRLAVLAVRGGARALVCSPQEVADVRREVGPAITLITPGVRPSGADVGDQSRTSTPEQALADGADLLVIGRPITGAVDPGDAAQSVARALRFVKPDKGLPDI
jgi:orotidine-5'-phosphate decarboxylase